MKKLTIVLALLLSLLTTATARQLNTWKTYMSYYNATNNVAAGNIVYSLTDGNLFAYDTEDGDVMLYDHLNKLSDIGIAHIAYNKEVKKLIIVYKNSNIDLLGRDGKIENLQGLKEKSLPDKEVTSICIRGKNAYLSTGFGFVEIDMQEALIRTTYRIGLNVACMTLTEDLVVLGTSNGIYICEQNKNMQVIDNWRQTSTYAYWTRLDYFDGQVVGIRASNFDILIPETGQIKNQDKNRKFTFMSIAGDEIFWGNATTICRTRKLDEAPTITEMDNQWSDVSFSGGLYWASEGDKGLVGYKIKEENFSKADGPIQPSSPKHDLAYHLSWVGNRLLVAGGVNTTNGVYFPATAMYYEDGKWTNFTEMEIPEKYSKMNLSNTTDLVQDPLDDTHHFASPFFNGLCEYRNGKFVKLYNSDNSPIKSIIPLSKQYYNYTSCSALSYDSEGNLWMANVQVDTMFHVLKPNGKWLDLSYPELDGVSVIDQILHHSSGIKLVSSRRIDMRGIFCFDTHGTDRQNDDDHVLHQTIVNQDGTSYTPLTYHCLAEDLEGRVWVGTSAGLFLIEDVTEVFNPNFRVTQIKINRNDGSGLADYLLNDVSISCIAIDPGNRLWVGTDGSGLYLISSDGQEMIEHFTVENSPLMSDNIQGIAVHPVTGEVMIGTDIGLCSWLGDATAAEEELEKSNVTAYPNPVDADYNGPISIRGLTSNAEVKIVTTGGQLIWSGRSNGGTCIWNGLTDNGQRVSSGIYHVIANTEDGEKAVVTRIVIVR